MKRKFTVTVGIPVFNEEINIQNLLRTLLKQRGDSFILQKIIVVSDGSTDNTEEKVNQLSQYFPVIKLVADKRRAGKAYRLNQLYQINTSDILITFDGDVLLAQDFVIEETVKNFINEKVGLVAIRDLPTKAENWQQQVVNTWFMLWASIRKDLNKGDNIYNLHGNAQAIRKEFAQYVIYPTGITADQDFLFLSLRKSQLTFKYEQKVWVYFRNPSSVSEYYFQATRFLTEKGAVHTFFSEESKNEYKVSRIYKAQKILDSFVHHPIFTLLACVLYTGLIFYFMKETDPLNLEGLWEPIKSTKKEVLLAT